MDLQENDSNLNNTQDEYIQHLEKQKQQLVTEARYLEAEEIKRKINELRLYDHGNKQRELENVQKNEIKCLDDAYNKEISEHFENWNIILSQFNEKAKMQEEFLNDRHKEEMNQFIVKLEEKFNSNIKFPKEYLDLKEVENSLVKLERYVEAHQIRSKCEIIERQEYKKHDKERMEKIKIKTDQLAIRQNLEKNALKQKLDLEYEEMKRKRNDEIEKIGLKYKKRKIELTIHHNSEKSIRSNPNTLKKRNVSMKISSSIGKKLNTSPSKKIISPEQRMKDLNKLLKKSEDAFYSSKKSSKDIKSDSKRNYDYNSNEMKSAYSYKKDSIENRNMNELLYNDIDKISKNIPNAYFTEKRGSSKSPIKDIEDETNNYYNLNSNQASKKYVNDSYRSDKNNQLSNKNSSICEEKNYSDIPVYKNCDSIEKNSLGFDIKNSECKLLTNHEIYNYNNNFDEVSYKQSDKSEKKNSEIYCDDNYLNLNSNNSNKYKNEDIFDLKSDGVSREVSQVYKDINFNQSKKNTSDIYSPIIDSRRSNAEKNKLDSLDIIYDYKEDSKKLIRDDNVYSLDYDKKLSKKGTIKEDYAMLLKQDSIKSGKSMRNDYIISLENKNFSKSESLKESNREKKDASNNSYGNEINKIDKYEYENCDSSMLQRNLERIKANSLLDDIIKNVTYKVKELDNLRNDI